ncbi:MAG: LPS-assembly protein LptD [Bacteroidales bacterium]|nr:LPS-assembly protein LptD [Bacteroidales bacterium]
MIFSLLCVFGKAQDVPETPIDSTLAGDSVLLTTAVQPSADTLPARDSVVVGDTIYKKISDGAIEKRVTYEARDSIVVDLRQRTTYLFGDAVVYYDDLELRADFIQLGFDNQELYATGIADSSGRVTGYPTFKQGETFFKAHEIKYNFKTTKGIISHVITVEGEGYIHGEKVKKLDDNTSFIRRGKYTTCELDDPHFEIAFTRAKVIPDDKIVMGPAYLSFGGVPTPLAIPFGYFPIQKGRRNGIIMPTFGQSTNRGFYLENFGYYFGIGEHFDMFIGGDIFTNGSWAVKLRSNYVFRYKCTGNINLSFAQNFFGERFTPSRYTTNDFKIHWEHKQDAKSHPTTRFSAHIDIMSSTFNKYNLSSVEDYLSNQYVSKLNLSTSAKGVFFVDMTASYTQNTNTGQVEIALPDVSMSVAQFYPFRKKNKSNLKWYDNISMQWSSQLINQISTQDSMILRAETWRNMQLGMRHSIPITIPIKIAKRINWNTTINLTEKWYLQRERQEFDTTISENVITSNINRIMERNFYALHDISLATTLTTKIYFLYQVKKERGLALRHVMTPSLSFTYTPNLSGNTYGEYFNTLTGEMVPYSYFASSLFGGVSNRSSAIARLSIANNVEMKVRSRKDTITGMKKIVLLDNLTVGCYYDFAADSLNWSMLTISGRTTLFKQLYITFSIGFDPYCYNDQGRRINVTEWKANHRLMRFSNSDLSISLNWTINQDYFKGQKEKREKKQQEQEQLFTENSLGMPNKRPDFSNPWSVTLSYTFAYTVKDNPYFYFNPTYYSLYGIYEEDAARAHTGRIVQTLNISGDFNITKKWKIGFTTGYDFAQKSFSYTSFDIYRDLHCWEMRFNWIPFGNRRGWSFTINVKASVLQDLKWNKKKDFRENF